MEIEQVPQLQKINSNNGSFKMDANLLLKEFDCSICFCAIEDCYVTRCGHVFCKECIFEAINRHHRCAICQGDLNENDVFKNYHFTNMRKMILQEQKKQSQEYLKKVFGNKQNQNEEIQELGELEMMIRTFLEKILLTYQQKFKESQDKFSQGEEKLKHQLNLKTQLILNEKQNDQTQVEIKQLTHDFERQMIEIQEQQKNIRKFYLESLKNQIDKFVPDPQLLDKRVQLNIPNHNIFILSHNLKPNSFISDLIYQVEDIFLKKNDPIVELKTFEKTGFIAIVKNGPNQKNIVNQIKQFQELSIMEFKEKILLNNLEQQIIIMQINSRQMVLNVNIEQGDQILILGEIKTKKQLPAECMTYTFQKDKPQIIDYYSCSDCNINWVCPGCMEQCHQGHKTSIYLKQHQATWACCYCASKTKNCQALNKFKKNK